MCVTDLSSGCPDIQKLDSRLAVISDTRTCNATGASDLRPTPAISLRTETPRTQACPVLLTRGQLAGKDVVTRTSGARLGVITRLWVDPDAWEVTALDVRPRGSNPLEALVSTTYFRSYWLCLNIAYVCEFFMQTLVKRKYMSQAWMLALQQILMSVSTVFAIQVLQSVHVLPALLSLALNLGRRGHEVSNGLVVLGAAVALGSRAPGLAPGA